MAHGMADAALPADDMATPNTPACTTRLMYGDAWIHGGNHPDNFDVANGLVTWDGVCTKDGANSYATLSNGWKPYFNGTSGCAMSFDSSNCSGAPASCGTRVGYGPSWLAPANHANFYDDVGGRLWPSDLCQDTGSQSMESLSNGWIPHFNANAACALSMRWQQCGGLYANPLLPACADPGVVRDGARYVAVCTSGNAADAFAIHVSTDLAHWTTSGHIFPSASKPKWAASDFWAPEIHRVGTGWVAYFTARHTDGKLSIGAATGKSATGPFTDIGAPLVHDAAMGLIDASEFEGADGTRYLIWKEDGNAVGKPTPIHGQPLAADGLSLTGSASTLITNDQAWEGAVVEGPWVVAHGGAFFLFYSGNSYANATYAVGVARSSSPLGPYTKAAAPIVTSTGPWVGPGHCSVVDGPAGETVMLYHAWAQGHVNGPGDARLMLVDRVSWSGANWPALAAAPSVAPQPAP